jgi:DNA ligase-1
MNNQINQHMLLGEAQHFVNRMKATSSLIEKKQIIKSIQDSDFITTAMYYTYNQFLMFNVTSKTCKKRSDLVGHPNTYGSVFTLLDDLANRVCTGHTAIANVNRFILEHAQYEDLIFSIIDRNLEIRASESVINKVIPGLIPTFDVALATKYESKFCDFETELWLASRKLDGVRCIIRKEGDTVKAYSRQGNQFTTLAKVLREVSFIEGDFVLDGEICLMDEKGNEDFQGVMKQIKRKDHTITNPKYVIFDCLTLDEFDTKEGTVSLVFRLDRNIVKCIHGKYDTLSVLEQVSINNEQELSDMITDADVNGFEGVMLRKNIGYEGKRSNNLLKCKKFFDAEYVVESCDFKYHRVIREGKEVVMPMLAQVYITHKGNQVAVGSGFNQRERIKYQANPEELIGKTITVQYFEETENQNGGIYDNGRNC